LGHNPFHAFVGHAYAATPLSVPVMLISIFMAVGGLFVGWLVYGRNPLKHGQPDPLIKALGSLYTLLRNKYYVDELYAATVVRFTLWLSETAFRFDSRWVVDPIVNLVGKAAVALANVGGAFDKVVVDGTVNGVAKVTDVAGRALRTTQTGKVQNYLLVVAVTVLMLLALYLYLPAL
jgi:NADH-quinone oxidoreductase subunit L